MGRDRLVRLNVDDEDYAVVEVQAEHAEGRDSLHTVQQALGHLTAVRDRLRAFYAIRGGIVSATGQQTTRCPSWCATDRPCGGEHQGPVSDPICATADLPTFIPEVGAVFPAITTALSWDTISGSEPGIWM